MQGRTQRFEAGSGVDSPTAAVPARLGKYQIIEPIGEGGFGIVFKGFDPFIKRHVAIKTCTSPDKELRQRYYREAEIAGRLDHPNIVRIFDFGTEDDTPYLVQEFLAGCDLDEKTAGKEFIPYPERLLYLIHIARGLAYAHEQGVVHRDIKPPNIRILDDGSAKIMDFGVAMLLNTETRLTREGMAVGTAAYLAPEQVHGKETDPRTDVFSFGVLAYELLTGLRPFERETISATLYSIVNDVAKPIGLPEHACPEPLRALIERCLEKDPDNRFAGFREICAELDDLRTEIRPGARPRDYDQEIREVGPTGATPSPATDRPVDTDRPVFDPQLNPPATFGAVRMQRRRRWLGVSLTGSVLLVAATAYGLLAAQGRVPWPGSTDDLERGAPVPSIVGELSVAEVSPTLPEELPVEETAGVEEQGSTETPAAAGFDATGHEDASEPAAAAEPAPPPVIEKATLILAPGWHDRITASIDGGEPIRLDRARSQLLEPGSYTVRYSLVTADYRDSRAIRVEIGAGEEQTLASPMRRPGMLSVQASLGSPQGMVHLDGEPLGLSPVRGFRLSPGIHRLQVYAVDHPTIALADHSLDVRSGRETVLTFDLTGQRELAVRDRPLTPQGES